MRRFLRFSTLLILTALTMTAIGSLANVAAGPQYGLTPPVPRATAAPPTPACANICGKSGVNVAWPMLQPMDDYLRAQRLGMGWVLELVLVPNEVDRGAEAIVRAQNHGLKPIVAVHCDLSTYCALSDPNVYAQYLQEVAAQVDGEFWALMGPTEPDSLGVWAGDAAGVAAYMNTVMAQVENIPNLRMVSPSFNLSNGKTDTFITDMAAAGARFDDLDAFAGTGYTVSGNGAYYYYAANSSHSPKMRQVVLSYGKPFIFTEFGTFDLLDKPGQDNPARIPVIQTMKSEFAQAANDDTVIGILHFNAFDSNPMFSYHELYDPEIVEITRDTNCTGSSFNQAGIGISTQETLWQLSGEPTCREFAYGCPFKGGFACPAGTCIDSDGDGFLGDGGGGACTRDDCNDSNPAIGPTCGGAVPDVSAAWGTIRTIENQVASTGAETWPNLEIRGNGLPIIAYHDGILGRGDLNVLDCTSPTCASALWRRLKGYDDLVGIDLSMQLKQDGNPFIVYYDKTRRDLDIYTCSDPGCATGKKRIIDDGTGRDGIDTSVAIRADGRPLVAYWHGDERDLRVFNCADVACSTGTIRNLDTSGRTGYNPSIIVGLDTNPLIAYSGYDNDVDEWQLRLFGCADQNCAGGGWNPLDLFSPATNDPVNSMAFSTHATAMRLSGLPVIVYRKDGSTRLMLYECTEPDCSSGVQHELYQGGQIESASMALLLDDSPFIAFSEKTGGTDYDLKLIRCLDESCTQTALETYSDGNAGAQPDVAIRPDGNPLVVFHDVGNGNLMLYDVDLSLVPGGIPTPLPTDEPTPTPSSTPTSTPTPTATPAFHEALMSVEDIAVNVGDTSVEVQISGHLPDSCTRFNRVDQSRDGSRIDVQVFTRRPLGATCAQKVTPFSMAVILEGEFPAGDYLVAVNGVERPFSAP